MFEEIRKLCALHELNMLSERGLIVALDYAAMHRKAPPAKRR